MSQSARRSGGSSPGASGPPADGSPRIARARRASSGRATARGHSGPRYNSAPLARRWSRDMPELPRPRELARGRWRYDVRVLNGRAGGRGDEEGLDGCRAERSVHGHALVTQECLAKAPVLEEVEILLLEHDVPVRELLEPGDDIVGIDPVLHLPHVGLGQELQTVSVPVLHKVVEVDGSVG